MVRVTPKPILVGERLQKLDMLLHIQEFSSMIAVITGVAEMGKTAILESASSQLAIHHQVISFSATTYQTESQVLTYISEQLNTDASWAAIENVLAEINAQNESINLLIDDAHFLSFELIEMMSVRAVSEDGWHLALAGEPSLYDTLVQIQSDLHHSNLVHHIDLIAISEIEAIDLAELYFKGLNFSAVPISAQKINQLWQLTEGVPGKLIDVFENEKDAKEIESARFPFGHVAAIFLIGIALSASYFYNTEDGSNIDPLDQFLAASVASKSVKSSDALIVEELGPAASENRRQPHKPVAQVEKLSVPPELAVGEVEVQSEDRLVVDINNKKSDVKHAPKLVVEKKLTVPASRLVDKLNGMPHPLLSAPSNGFALQLLGVRNRESAEKVMFEFKQALNSDQLSVYETKYKGQPWFVVVYGPINNQQKARQKAGSIAKTLKNQPWVRPMAKIQEDIRRIKP
jgi:DamX protein